jgi:carbon-monoxide dehydrogenase medium subunit
MYQTALAADEMLVAVEIRTAQPGEHAFFQECARRMGDYAIIGLAAQAKLGGNRIETIRLAYFGVGERPAFCVAAAEVLQKQPFTPAVLADAQTALAQDLQPQNDHQASAAMRIHLARTLLARCTNELLGQSVNGEAGPT